MASLVIEHIKSSELPRKWAEQLRAGPEETFTVRIEPDTHEERSGSPIQANPESMPAFGMWRDHAQAENPDVYARGLRARRY